MAREILIGTFGREDLPTEAQQEPRHNQRENKQPALQRETLKKTIDLASAVHTEEWKKGICGDLSTTRFHSHGMMANLQCQGNDLVSHRNIPLCMSLGGFQRGLIQEG